MKNKILQIIGGGLLGYGIMLVFLFLYFLYHHFFGPSSEGEDIGQMIILSFFLLIAGILIGVFRNAHVFFGTVIISLIAVCYRLFFDNLYLSGGVWGYIWYPVSFSFFLFPIIFGWILGFLGRCGWNFLKRRVLVYEKKRMR